MPAAQPAQLPPQSTPVSSPFLAKSSQLGAAHFCCKQTKLLHPSLPTHARPLPQPAHCVPPQSTTISSWFWRESLQVAAAQSSPTQLPLLQSESSRQRKWTEHGPHEGPP